MALEPKLSLSAMVAVSWTATVSQSVQQSGTKGGQNTWKAATVGVKYVNLKALFSAIITNIYRTVTARAVGKKARGVCMATTLIICREAPVRAKEMNRKGLYLAIIINVRPEGEEGVEAREEEEGEEEEGQEGEVVKHWLLQEISRPPNILDNRRTVKTADDNIPNPIPLRFMTPIDLDMLVFTHNNYVFDKVLNYCTRMRSLR